MNMEIKKVVSTALAGCLMFALVGSANAATIPVENIAENPIAEKISSRSYWEQIFEGGQMRIDSTYQVVGSGVATTDNNLFQFIIDYPKVTGTMEATIKIGSRTYKRNIDVKDGTPYAGVVLENISIRKGDKISVTLWTNRPGYIGGVRCICWS